MDTPIASPPPASPPAETRRVDVTALLAAAVRLGAAHDTNAQSTKHLALAELVRAYRAMPVMDRNALVERFTEPKEAT